MRRFSSSSRTKKSCFDSALRSAMNISMLFRTGSNPIGFGLNDDAQQLAHTDALLLPHTTTTED
ncbi:hypothetical protein [[Eubacterium] cellulosolvens]